MYKTRQAFTLIEVIVSISILSIIIVVWFSLYFTASKSKIKLIEQANLDKNVFYFSEKLFFLVKSWWTIDYEEYFNRKVLWDSLKNWHYEKKSWFWNFGFSWVFWTNNFWFWHYYCLSWAWVSQKLTKDWCWNNNKNTFSLSPSSSSSRPSYSWHNQRYWQYSFQFLDLNSNYDNDFWDENNDNRITWDDDDLYMWNWPEAFDHWKDLKELYLISWNKKLRTFIRWNLKDDEFIKLSNPARKCDPSWNIPSNLSTNPNQASFSYCRWALEFLQLSWVDWWNDHNKNSIDSNQNDWIIDTWLISKRFIPNINNEIIAWSLADNWKFWKELFSDEINITDFKVFAYPNIDITKIWNLSVAEQNKYLVSPYVTISMKIKPSWKIKSKIKGDIKEISFNTTINLTDIFSN